MFGFLKKKEESEEHKTSWTERLKAGLAEIDTGRPVTGNVAPERLSSLERDLLKDALAVVKRFKALLHQRLRLDVL
mgnify:CR=1 FL=1